MTQIGRQDTLRDDTSDATATNMDADKVAVHPDPEGVPAVKEAAFNVAIRQATSDNAAGGVKVDIAPPAKDSGSSLPLPE